MLIRYNLSHVFYPGSDKVLNALTLQIMMKALVAIDRAYLVELRRAGHVIPLLYQSGVVYGRTNWWESTLDLHKRGYGDCKTLAATWIAEQSLLGIHSEPVFRWVENDDGSIDYHILCQLAGDKFEDPSKVLGMGKDEVAKFYGPKSY